MILFATELSKLELKTSFLYHTTETDTLTHEPNCIHEKDNGKKWQANYPLRFDYFLK